MPEYIGKEKLLDTLHQCLRGANHLGKHNDASIYASAISLVDEQPATDVAPVVHGEWRVESYMDEYESPPKRVYAGYSCSRCGCSNAIKTRYCARCGAKMDGGENHD